MAREARSRIDLGDFQTPVELTREVCALLSRQGISPTSVVEPTCGIGSFLLAALDAFPEASRYLAVELDRRHCDSLGVSLRERGVEASGEVLCQDFFETRWDELVAALPRPILVIGNPPWVTNAALGFLGSSNLPRKSNIHSHRGIDAITGRSNFDISEWMLIRLLDLLGSEDATLAMLCKTAVARKVLSYAWKRDAATRSAHTYSIDAAEHFGAAVDACLLVYRTGDPPRTRECVHHASLTEDEEHRFGFRDGALVANVRTFDRWRHLRARTPVKWRSGVKHDCARVMELRPEGSRLRNGLGEVVDLEDTYLFPMLKSSELAKGRTENPIRRMLVTQRTTGERTDSIAEAAPRTWRYLLDHAERLDRRASTIYAKRPRFSIFGVGDYTFAPWKVAISGFYKRLAFSVVGPHEGRPVVFDDTCYFLPCETRGQAELLAELLESEPARELYAAFVFWDAKRPITSRLLGRLDLVELARELGRESELREELRSGGPIAIPGAVPSFRRESGPSVVHSAKTSRSSIEPDKGRPR